MEQKLEIMKQALRFLFTLITILYCTTIACATMQKTHEGASFEKIYPLEGKISLLTELVAPISVDPSKIRFSQSSVNGAAELTESMVKNGWKGDPIHVVRMADGGLTTLDNTRVLAASRAGVEVKSIIHNADDALPANWVERFTTRKGGAPSTYGEALLNRIQNQNRAYRTSNPNGSFATGSKD